LILLSKNEQGYKNLSKLVSYGYTEGFYYTPRIDKEILRKYNEGLIVLSACLGGEIPQAIMKNGIEKAEEITLEFKELFKDDFYLEIMLHESGNPQKDQEVFENQKIVNKAIIELGKKHNIKVVATNDVHFINAEDADAHDRLICLNTGKDVDDPTRMRYTTQEFFKTTEEMSNLFSDIPEAIENTNEIVEKITDYNLNKEPIMPEFKLPSGFDNEDDYLRYLTYEGAKPRYKEITEEVRERIDFELGVIKNMGFPGYFLIVQDFLHAARNMGVSVGPGRGSAAGSVVAYCNGITDIDPIKYDLLFERFLNPDRISMPDIDIDFDDDGREKVLEWVVEKYGEIRVANIVTFGTMAAKSAIRDIARVENLPLSEAMKLAKLVPEKPGTTLKKAFAEVPELKEAKDKGDALTKKVLNFAETLEGSVRHTGLHACGIIIGKDDLEQNIPVFKPKDSKLYATQYDGNHVEDVGMLKMDFLGLKTLSIIKDALETIKESKNVDVDIDHIPLDDKKTFELYSKGNTTGIFQFESDGMKKHLRNLKPDKFEDLIAMNALYRPGPMEYIPSFINRKHGRQKIEYDLPEMEEHLKDTYGITVYQEQVMLLSQKLANFTKGQADSLRKAMGKKKKDLMAQLKVKFVDGCKNNGFKEKTINKIWTDWEAFAQYAFNKSHSTCYAYVSYQTAYLKAHYPAEFMAAVLSRNINDIKKITIFMSEAQRMGMSVLGPDVNESNYKFTVNKDGNIRFGLGAIKGVGEGAAIKIIEERKQTANYKNIFDFVERVSLQTVNKKNIEGLATAGAFDNIDSIERGQYFTTDNKNNTFIENIVKYGNTFQNDQESSQPSLFGGSESIEISKPTIPTQNNWTKLTALNNEKELIGIYLSAHPLDDYKLEIDTFCNTKVSELNNLEEILGKEITIAGIVTEAKNTFSKNGKPFGFLTIQDFSDSYRMAMFGNDYAENRTFFYENYPLLIKGRVQVRPYNQDELEFKVKKIIMLSDVREEMIKSISLKINITSINNELIKEIKNLAENNKGNSKLKIKVIDKEDKVSLDLFSRTYRVNITKELINYIEKNSHIFYSIN
ncbi:MAG: DNA polymerase III subunit alpha, partial [Bacteroidota bacterium]|nr:DNA polymerase III subunit alpha [Bacteroidota bacterium]